MIKQTFSQNTPVNVQLLKETELCPQIYNVFLEVGKTTGEFDANEAWTLTNAILAKIKDEKIEVYSQIEDGIESVLLQSPYHASAKMVIVARTCRDRASDLAKQVETNRIDQYLSQLDWEVKESSNMSYSLQGLNHYLSGAESQSYWLYKVYPEHIRKAHEAGDFHLHDLTQLSVYCVGWDLLDLLKEGFCGVPKKLEANPPKHFRTALGQVVNFFYTLQGEAAGAQAFSNFDTLLAPFIRRDHLTEPMVEQALQEFIFNINVPTRTGFQTPFTNITLDLFCPKHLANVPIMIGGEYQQETYGEFQHEMDIFNRAFFKIIGQGDAHGRVITFPIPTINLAKDFDWDNDNLKGLWEITGKYGIPYFSNFINSDMQPEDTRSMCCRLRIDNTHLEKRGGGLFGANPLTGSIGVVTINLPRIAYLSQDKAAFFMRLSALMELAKESLEIKRSFLEKLTAQNLYPYTTFYLRWVKKHLGCYWKNHFSTVGIVGMNEACLNLLGEDITSKAGKQFALEVLDNMREKMIEFQKETGNHFNLEATPAESTAFRLASKDRNQFGNKIINASTSEVPFYTNSVHVPVDYTDDLFALLDHQDDLQTKFTGGTVVHCFLGERIYDTNAVKHLVKKIASTYKLPYFSLTPTFSICQEHGYLSGERKTCPYCDAKTEIYSRVVGYLRPVQQWNDGKQAEFAMRKTLA
ncbi:MAG: ribonucleoside triphosphate reductase [Puniceicoccales bacterium]|jgi:ribonucleoside-triphosphate reductase|nr:ribonucleoside triphosphate reductase [Puniceicoccales bacterium]